MTSAKNKLSMSVIYFSSPSINIHKQSFSSVNPSTCVFANESDDLTILLKSCMFITSDLHGKAIPRLNFNLV